MLVAIYDLRVEIEGGFFILGNRSDSDSLAKIFIIYRSSIKYYLFLYWRTTRGIVCREWNIGEG